jgi:hypothetical protein
MTLLSQGFEVRANNKERLYGVLIYPSPPPLFQGKKRSFTFVQDDNKKEE